MEQEDEKEECAVDLGDGQHGPDYGLVDSVDAETQQHDADAGFDSHVGNDVDRFTKPPELYKVRLGPCDLRYRIPYLDSDWKLLWGLDVPSMLSCAMMTTSDSERSEDNEEGLYVKKVSTTFSG